MKPKLDPFRLIPIVLLCAIFFGLIETMCKSNSSDTKVVNLKADTINTQSKTDDIMNVADAAVKSFTWDIEKFDNGTLMFLDVPYTPDNSSDVEYLSLTVAKNESKNRPVYISVVLPNKIIQSHGILLTFAKAVTTKTGDSSLEFEKEEAIRVNVEQCSKDDCRGIIKGGYFTQEDGKKTDVFQKFLEFDMVLFLFVNADGNRQTLLVPLFSFKEEYKKLE